MKKQCIITFCNEKYLEKAKNTIKQLREVGKYQDDIVLMIGNDLKDKNVIIDEVIVKYFPDIDRSDIINLLKNKNVVDTKEIRLTFQWHKVHIFDTYFKQWEKCLCIDAGMHIFKPVDKIMNLDCTDKIIGHSDAYPTYEWKLSIQFNKIDFPELYAELESKYDLNIDYFQGGFLLFDTNILNENTKDDIIQLSNKYYSTRNNEQPILNLYFNCTKKIWKKLIIKDDETYYYDYWERDNLKYSDYIMLKYPKTIYR